MDSGQINQRLERMLGGLERRVVWIALCVVLSSAAVYFISKQQPKKYTATASLVFPENQLGQQVAGLPVASGSNQQAQRSTNVTLVQLGDMAAQTALRLDSGLTKEAVSTAVSVSAQGESNVVDVSAKTTSPALSAAIANTYATVFVTEQQKANHAFYASAVKAVAKQLAALSSEARASSAGVALQSLAQSLGVLADLRTGVRVAQAATVPTSSSTPRVLKNTILAAAFGLLLGLAVALLLERFDWRIRAPEDLAGIYRLPLLGVVPLSKAFARASHGGSPASRELLPPREAEAFHLIRAHLHYFNLERELRTLLVASAESGDGKTTIARQLAVTAASMGSTVLLVEADLRHPTIAEQLGIAAGPGLADVLTGSVSLWRATQPVAIDQPTAVAPRPLALDVLVAGASLPPNPAELTESAAMAAMLAQAQETYDLVVLDTSPLSVVSDAFPLLRSVDGVVIVGRLGRSRRPAERLKETLERVGAPLVGVVANGVIARGREPYYAEAEADWASVDGTSAEPADERVHAEAEKPSGSSGLADAGGAHGAGSSRGAPASPAADAYGPD